MDLENKTWYMGDLGVKMHRYVLEDNKIKLSPQDTNSSFKFKVNGQMFKLYN